MNSPFTTTPGGQEPYVYQPFENADNQIRLLCFKRETNSFHLEIFDAMCECHFEALSYTWGDGTETRTIEVDGAAMEISLTLFQFLERFARECREEETERGRIWIDQICINQKDLVERSHQVLLMSKIYSRAAKVIVWLGQSEDAHAVVPELEELKKTNHSIGALLGLKASLVFFDHAWWRRLWIVQEVVLSRDCVVYYRNATISWSFIKAQVTMLHISQLDLKLLHRQYLEGSLSLLGALKSTAAQCCREVKDRLYAIQSLLKPRDRIIIDYTKSDEEVFWDAFTILARDHQLVSLVPATSDLAYRMRLTEDNCPGASELWPETVEEFRNQLRRAMKMAKKSFDKVAATDEMGF